MAGKMDLMAKKSGLIMVVIIIVVLVIVTAFFFFVHEKIKRGGGGASSTPSMTSARDQNKSSVSNPSSAYGAMAAEKDILGAKTAQAGGMSFVPGFAPPPVSVSPITEASVPKKSGFADMQTASAAQRTQSGTAAQATPTQEQVMAERQKAAEQEVHDELESKRKVVNQMRGPFAAEGYTEITRTYGLDLPPAAKPATDTGGKGDGTGPKKVFIKAGDHAFVSIDTAINTDVESPVKATILSGPANRLTLFGSVTHNANDTISIVFKQISLPDGTSTPVAAYAIDPATGSAAVVGSVDHKIFQRFVMPGIAGGAAAYSQIMQQQGMQTMMMPLAGTAVSSGTMSSAQIADAAIGAGIGNAATILSNIAATEKPAVSTEQNLGLEVVFMKEVIIQESHLTPPEK